MHSPREARKTAMFDWNDLKFFLAVAREGSTLAASRSLKVSQATVSRRITLFEEQLGVELFARHASGYVLTARGEALLPLAEGVQAEVARFAAGLAAESRRLSGAVKLTTVESAAGTWVIPALARLRESHPGIEVEVISTDRNLDLASGEADVAIRFGSAPSGDTLIARRLAELQETAYANRELVTRLGRPASAAELARYPLISDGGVRFDAWLEREVPEGRIVQRVNSISGVLASVKAGIGAALLPCMIGDGARSLVRLMPPIPELTTDCWLVTTDQARRQPHVRAAIDAVVAHIEAVSALPGPDPEGSIQAG
jgi:DNA-binding transcriptional LysR family regulator